MDLFQNGNSFNLPRLESFPIDDPELQQMVEGYGGAQRKPFPSRQKALISGSADFRGLSSVGRAPQWH
jgi:hypothetical protein